MQISVKGKQIDVGDALREHVEFALEAAVEKYFENALEAHVAFSREGPMFRSDISVHVGRGIQLQGHATTDNAYSAFDTAAEHIDKRLRRYKRRLRDHHKSVTGERLVAQQYILAEESETVEAEPEADTQPVVIAEMETEILTLTVSEAVMRMDLANLPTLMFRNKAHGGLNVVYRRLDGNIGWIDPQTSSGKSGAA
jgi:ribosomal subunit interface protein